MDTILSEFIARTSADPGFATDLLEGHGWDLQKALSAFYFMKGITPELEILPSDLELAPKDGDLMAKPLHNQIDPKKISDTFSSSPSKPPLLKADAFEIDDGANKKLTRGISRATDNVNLVSKARNEFAQDFKSDGRESSPSHILLETPIYTFTLPNLANQPEDFREFLEKDLIETSTLVSLEQAGRLNWWADLGACQRLWPLATNGDGNCLLHAASLGMWGFHDRLLTLRRALHSVLLKSTFTDAFYRRWRWQTTLQNKEAGLVYCEEEWAKEWKNLLQMASTEPRSRVHQRGDFACGGIGGLDTVLEEEAQSRVYESLEEIHVLALAHVLRRPVIVIADTMLKDVTGEPFAPIPFGGIYIPLECTPAECHRSPLCLTYDAAHFSALVAMERDYRATLTPCTVAAIPLTDPERKILHIQFAVDPGKDVRWGIDENDPWIISKLTLTDKDKFGLLNEYLDVVEIPLFAATRSDLDPYRSTTGSLANGYSEYELKRATGSFDSEDSLNNVAGSSSNHRKSKASKQLHTMAKQFGSLGRSVSKKIKKNFNSLTRRSASFKTENEVASSVDNKDSNVTTEEVKSEGIVAAVLHTDKRHEYQEEMIKNYLSSAKARFEKEKSTSLKQDRKKVGLQPTVPCVNPGCSMYGTMATNYLCSSCFSTQKKAQESEFANKKTSPDDGVVVTSGNSEFYTESDADMLAAVAKMPLGTRNSTVKQDQTLYLAKSVFYRNDGERINNASPKTVDTSQKDQKIVNQTLTTTGGVL